MFENLNVVGVTATGIAVVVAIVLTVVISKFLNTKKSSVLSSIENEQIRTYVDLLLTTVEDTVNSLNQTMVDGLKAQSSDGKLTEDEAKLVKDTAVATVLDSFSENTKAILSMVFDDLEKYVDTLVESAVKKAKDQNPIG